MQRRALVVDDSRAMRLILSDLLATLGFEVDEAKDGQDALSVLKERNEIPSLALVDWNMPVMNGFDFIKAVRTERCFDVMKLLVVTSEAELNQMMEAIGAGADEYLMKPFSSEALASKLSIMGVAH